MTGFAFDAANELHARALRRLETAYIGWLGTTGRDGFPHAVPVWFVWHEGAVVTFTQPHAAKARNLRADPRAMFHVETEDEGEDWVMLQGTAEFSAESSGEWMTRIGDDYLVKYQVGLDRLGWTAERLTDDYSLVVVLRPHKLIG